MSNKGHGYAVHLQRSRYVKDILKFDVLLWKNRNEKRKGKERRKQKSK